MRSRTRRPVLLSVFALVLVAGGGAVAEPSNGDTGPIPVEVERDIVDLSPDVDASWSLRNVFAPITGLFMGGPGYWYDTRRIEIDTTPAHGVLDLFYVRANFQKRFEQAQSPATVILPPRIRATARDALIIRAFAEGYRQQKLTIKVGSRQDRVVIDLEPLPNTLRAIAHSYFGGRSSLSFLLTESPTFRIQEAEDGISLILSETAMTPESRASVEGTLSPVLSELYAQQLGEDLLIKIGFAADSGYGEPEVRSRQSFDAARELHRFTLDLVPAEGSESVVRARAALAKVRTRNVTGCALRFEQGLRAGLDEGSLARALAPSGSFTDSYLRAAMRRLGEISPDHAVRFTSGAVFRPQVPIELEAALSQASRAIGYLALLRTFVLDMEGPKHQTETLRGLIAPELGSEPFAAILSDAEAQQLDCIASG